MTFFSKFCLNLPVILPSSNFKLLWDFLMILSIWFMLFVIPIRISLNIPYSEFIPESSVNLASILIFTDIIISLNTGFYDKGNPVVNRWNIFKKYLSTALVSEILGCFSLII